MRDWDDPAERAIERDDLRREEYDERLEQRRDGPALDVKVRHEFPKELPRAWGRFRARPG